MAQLEKMGAKQVSDINRLPRKMQVPLLLSTNKRIESKSIYEVANHNKGILVAQGVHRRQQAALSLDRIVQEQIDTASKEFEVEVEEIPVPGSEEFMDKGHTTVAEGLRVDKSGTPPPASAATKKGKKS
jgi:hypothetical protein